MVQYYFDQLPLEINMMIVSYLSADFKLKVSQLDSIFPQMKWCYSYPPEMIVMGDRLIRKGSWRVKVKPKQITATQTWTWNSTAMRNYRSRSMQAALQTSFPEGFIDSDVSGDEIDEVPFDDLVGYLTESDSDSYDLVKIPEVYKGKYKLFLD